MMIRQHRKETRFRTWINPDGSEGGNVSENADIDESAVVEKFALVLSGTTVGPNAIVRAGDIVSELDTVRFGPYLPLSRLRRTSFIPK